MQVTDLMMKEVDTQIRECATLLKEAPEAKTKKHMLAFARLLGLNSMLAYYLAHQPDAMMPAQKIDSNADISECVKICDDICSSIESKRPTDTVRVNQIFLDVCAMMTMLKPFIPARILHLQPSVDEPIVKDDRFESNMAELVRNIEMARKAQALMCTESMPCTASMPVASPEILDEMASAEILSQYFPGCGALGAPATPTTPTARRSLSWGSPDVQTDDARDIEGDAGGDTEDDGIVDENVDNNVDNSVDNNVDGSLEDNVPCRLVRCETRNLKRARTECV